MKARSLPMAPCTMYKPVDMARAKENIQRHGWARKVHETLRETAQSYEGMSRDRLRSFIPDKTPLITVACPQCGNGPWSAYRLINDADTLQCVSCEMAWDFDPDDTSETWNIHGVIRAYRLRHIMEGLDALGLTYRLSGEQWCAEKAAQLVERFAEVFRGYRVNRVNRNEWYENNAYHGKISGWKWMDGHHMRKALLAYDLIRDSGALSQEQCGRIDTDLVAYARDFFMEGYGQAGFLGSPQIQDQGPVYWSVAACGALLGDAKTLRSIVALFEQMLDPGNGIFHEDGSFFEGSACYADHFLKSLAGAPEIVRGNITPDVYSNPRCALLARCYTWALDTLYPDGRIIPANDTLTGTEPPSWWSEVAFINFQDLKAARHLCDLWGENLDGGSEYSLFFRDPDMRLGKTSVSYSVDSAHLPGMGLMILRHGQEAASRTTAFIDYGPYLPRVHKHEDYLNFGLWACGMDMVSEMGYSARLWIKKALDWQREVRSHNTVAEVGTQQEGGEPLLWCITPGVKLAEAGVPGANSRFIALLPRDDGGPIVVDIFRVQGDLDEYNWIMHARAEHVEVMGEEDRVSAKVAPPLRSGWSAMATGDIAATWRLSGQTPCGLMTLLPMGTPSRLTLSECPPEQDVLAAYHVGGGNPVPGVAMPYRPHLQITQPGPKATFVAIHVPFEGPQPPIVTASRHVASEHPDAVALEVACGMERFLILHAHEPADIHFEALHLQGRCAIASLRNGVLRSLCLAGGACARFDQHKILCNAAGNAYEDCEQGE